MTYPVTTFEKPERKRALEAKIEPCRAKAVKSGIKVPRSPKLPEISAKVNWDHSW
jgi:hypothetical protein